MHIDGAFPALPRPSTSVLLAREGPSGIELFMVRRHAGASTLPGGYVFPGGTVRADDSVAMGSAPREGFGRLLSARSDLAVSEADAAALYACALRELFEEAGVLLARTPEGQVLEAGGAALEERRTALQREQVSLAGLLRGAGLSPAFDQLRVFSHWVTPALAARRYDTWFFLVRMPRGQVARHCGTETTEGAWLRPREMLEGARAGVYDIILPTERHLARVAQHKSLDALWTWTDQKPIRRVEPFMERGRLPWIDPTLQGVW